ncbi:DcaP family trimeric outer membrane transporter [Thalassotalea sp. ND16A]|uniref:DcaP family trimeric outer membrane transporter n=1 Tax=Thalassotalea sp. ND16A TaxID=1535422 RepID=UPI00051A2F38|nr:DcaP family trimeric outer membrane transporter [Thalassotalea sp. ND16A]KGK00595.1 hypothetical protein ND16A_3355 [Thalassotalea sp. ND16A]
MNKLICSTAVCAALASTTALASYEININEKQKLSFGGYFKADLRNVNGDIAYRDFWIGNNAYKPDTNETRFSVRESRFNIKYQHSDVTAVLEWDFYDDQQPTGASETVTGGHSLRLRHAYAQYGNWKVGQTWSTFMPLVSIADALDFGGAHVGQTFIRQTQVRYTNNGLELALENPSTQSGKSQSVPDVVARYTFKGDWGQVALAGLMRTLDDGGDPLAADGSQFAYNIHGRIKAFGEDDIRFSYNGGRSGRYVSPGANIHDLADDGDIHETQAYTLAYRHLWNDTWRSSLYYGAVKIDELDADRKHWGLNLIKSLSKQLSIGAEIGNYKTEDGDSDYIQLSAKYVL